MDFKLELVAIPVSDVDRAKDFYVNAGFNLDHDHTVSDDIRFVHGAIACLRGHSSGAESAVARGRSQGGDRGGDAPSADGHGR